MTAAVRAAEVAVTGIGVVAPTGVGLAAHWAATLAGRRAIGRITRFDPTPYPSTLAGEVAGFDPGADVPGRLLPQTDRMTQFALAASVWALADAELDTAELDPFSLGVITASASGGFEYGQRELEKLWSKGPTHVSAYMSFAWFYAVNSGQLSIRHGLRGPTGVFVTEQAGGLDAVAQARRKVRKGLVAALTGGMDASLCPYGLAAQLATGRVSRADDPARAYLPFTAEAAGHVPGEGGAILLVEDAERARARGARVYGTVAGYGATFDPPPGSGRPPTLVRAVERALADAGLSAADIAVVFADAAGTPELDRAEAEAIGSLFGPRGVPVTAPKALTGRLYSGAASLDVATALMALREGVIPPTAVPGAEPGLALDLVTGRPRPLRGDAALVLARGHGGFNAAVVLRGPMDGREGR
ncbi:ketosynthase chain-length factor [Saccharothrix australiensis]|uniref:Act minimal PKS chain-length factor (CLF/KS beta) n=1 Tax=Saccharothrix australiensis TaxID=2072 RepID=A0A495W3J3_9PSEU|nr:ketosynthase chain-length factor [Saccharothrix australiensis]RKT55617.1 act minimal PKS chain-length factor (CLF/KS beta) [Saccharothrix australiensis]